MSRRLGGTAAILMLTSVAFAQVKQNFKPNVNESKDYPNVIHSPSASATPTIFRSVVQLELVVKKGKSDARVIYANGTAVTKDGLVVAVIDAPGTNKAKDGGVESAAVLNLDGSSSAAQLVRFEPAYGVAIFKTHGLQLRPLQLAKSKPVAERRVTWHTVYRSGRKTILYSRPLRLYKATHRMGAVEDVCRVIDRDAHTALSAERSGSALLALDGTLVGLMGRQKHWNISPKNSTPRTKTAWAVPAHVIARLIGQSG